MGDILPLQLAEETAQISGAKLFTISLMPTQILADGVFAGLTFQSILHLPLNIFNNV